MAVSRVIAALVRARLQGAVKCAVSWPIVLRCDRVLE